MPKGHISILCFSTNKHEPDMVFGFREDREQNFNYIKMSYEDGKLNFTEGYHVGQFEEPVWEAAISGELKISRCRTFVEAMHAEEQRGKLVWQKTNELFDSGYNSLNLTLFLLKLSGFLVVPPYEHGKKEFSSAFQTIGSIPNVETFYCFSKKIHPVVSEGLLKEAFKEARESCCKSFLYALCCCSFFSPPCPTRPPRVVEFNEFPRKANFCCIL
jgi:hypothetical protein